MRLIGKLLALPFMLVTGILYLVCKFLVVLSGAVLGILSGIIFLAALVLFFVAGFLPGLAWLMIAPANLTPENREYRRVGRPSNGVDQHERKLNKMLDKVFAFAVEHVDDWNLDHRITTRLLAE